MLLARLLPFLVVALAVAGCAEREASPTSSTSTVVTDDLGREVAIETPVERVLTLAPSLTETLVAAGGGSLLVGASQADDYPPGVDSLPRYGTYPLDLEAVVALQPDLVLATNQVNNPDDARPLADAGIPTYFFSFDAVADVPRALRTVGTLVGTEDQAEAAADRFERQMRSLAARTDSLDRPRTLLLIGDETLFAFGDASYTQTLIEIAGGESVTADFDGEAVTLSEEFVLEAAPEVIIGAFGEDYDPERLLALHPAWGPVPAVVTGRVHSIDPDLILRPGPRLADGAETLARLLHPELGDEETREPGIEDMSEEVSPTDSTISVLGASTAASAPRLTDSPIHL
jgi:iron complex transport system substrate-binding protein